eukprot:Rhum_TRINITY_DN15177_c4_g14::Rhum_TRINITY_DN15177_c4_g14_i1::g.141378::m.141378
MRLSRLRPVLVFKLSDVQCENARGVEHNVLLACGAATLLCLLLRHTLDEIGVVSLQRVPQHRGIRTAAHRRTFTFVALRCLEVRRRIFAPHDVVHRALRLQRRVDHERRPKVDPAPHQLPALRSALGVEQGVSSVVVHVDASAEHELLRCRLVRLDAELTVVRAAAERRTACLSRSRRRRRRPRSGPRALWRCQRVRRRREACVQHGSLLGLVQRHPALHFGDHAVLRLQEGAPGLVRRGQRLVHNAAHHRHRLRQLVQAAQLTLQSVALRPRHRHRLQVRRGPVPREALRLVPERARVEPPPAARAQVVSAAEPPRPA